MTATTKHIPGKRIKTWHRNYRLHGGVMSLRQYARLIIATPISDSRSQMEHDTASKWAGGKVTK